MDIWHKISGIVLNIIRIFVANFAQPHTTEEGIKITNVTLFSMPQSESFDVQASNQTFPRCAARPERN